MKTQKVFMKRRAYQKYHVLMKHRQLGRAAMLHVASDTLSGIKALHRARIVHLDIKPGAEHTAFKS